MTTPVLGPNGLEGFECHLPLDEDFVAVIEIPDDEPALDLEGSVRLVFNTTPQVIWEGELVETDPGQCRRVDFVVDEAQVDELRALRPRTVRLQYVIGEAKLLWDRGRVRDV